MPAISISGFARSKQKAMRRDLERRLQRLEPARSGSSALEIWVTEDDGTLCSPRGERITRQTFDRRQTTRIVEVLSPTNPFGIKAGGEGGCTPALAVVISAVLDALAPLGVRDLAMPATPFKVWQAIRDARSDQHL